ncbi:hypothetical protein HPB52_014071 [Rhipicephalus sanguineus]|uniref:Beta-galactosidase 1-like first all-beta domain-containing protein n=1 Tax=Rhipicephalus sanguineus TaxID=34632 RepID=A0A9D4Q6W3_RHISA|nr:hypothetical protein HPB52_014071 [Rhipicephalus sanguineus]
MRHMAPLCPRKGRDAELPTKTDLGPPRCASPAETNPESAPCGDEAVSSSDKEVSGEAEVPQKLSGSLVFQKEAKVKAVERDGSPVIGRFEGKAATPSFRRRRTSDHRAVCLRLVGRLRSNQRQLPRRIPVDLPGRQPPFGRMGGRLEQRHEGLITTRVLAACFPRRDIVARTMRVFGLCSQALVLYDTIVAFLPRDPGRLSVPGLRDRGYVYVNDLYQGVISRMENVFDIMVSISKGQRLSLLVESQGRNAYGDLNDPKGVISDVTLSGIVLTHWNVTAIDERKVLSGNYASIPQKTCCAPGLAVYEAKFTLSSPLDTFLRLDRWKKGM